MTENSITLNWSKFIGKSELSFPEHDEYGVYLWGFSIENEFIPYYVGIADKITFRIFEHLNSIIGGLYAIYHRNSLANFKEYKNQKVNLDHSFGKVYSPNWPKEYKIFIDLKHLLNEHIDFMIDNFIFSYATVDKEIVSKKDLKEIEKICISQFGIENLQNMRSGHSNRFHIEHAGNKNVINKIKATNR